MPLKPRTVPALVSRWLVFLAVLPLAAARPLDHDRPNIVLVLADDLGPGDVRAYNPDSRIPTPHPDRLGAEGMIFMDAHSNSGVCTPTRYGILTGRYAWRTRLKARVLGGYSPPLIEAGCTTVASLLRERGYATGCFGKWHLGMDWPFTDESPRVDRASWQQVKPRERIARGPNAVGFDYFFGMAGSLNMAPHAYIENDRMLGKVMILPDRAAMDAPGFTQPSQPGHAAAGYVQQEVLARLARRSTAWIRRPADQPFFAYIPLPSPHSPIVPSERFQGQSGLNGHGDFTMESDWLVGEVLRTLDELELAENTLFIFTSDNGASPRADFPGMAQQGHHSSWICRGMKGTNWEGGHRVPFLVRWPGQVAAGSRSDQLICTTDLLATAADLVDLELADDAGEDSVSFLPALPAEPVAKSADRVVVHHSDTGIFAIRQGRWKMMFDDFGGSYRPDPRQHEPIAHAAQLQLFDMEIDATEDVNLAGQKPEVVESLRQALADIIKAGRSTTGVLQPTDLVDRIDDWPQLDPIRPYLD